MDENSSNIKKVRSLDYLDHWHKHVLDLMADEDSMHHSISTDINYYSWWMERAFYFNHTRAICSILDHLEVPCDGLDLKERLSYYALVLGGDTYGR